MDRIDSDILSMLRADSRRSFVDIGKSMGLSESAVRRRVRSMTGSGTIKRFTIEVDHGDATSAIVLVSVDSGTDTSTVSQELAGLDGARMVYEITGQYDIATIISSSSIGGINDTIDALRKIKGVTDTNTVIILRRML